jgi:hypothetical protein
VSTVVVEGAPRLRPQPLALAAAALTLALTVAAVPLTVISGAQLSGLPAVPFGIVGYLVASRQRRNPIGWILLALALLFLLASDAGQYAIMAYRQGYHLPLPRVAVFLAAWWIWLAFLLPLPVGLFPYGRLSGRWRLVLYGYLAVCLGLLTTITFRDVAGIGAHRIRIDSTGELASTGSPSGIAGVFWPLLIAFCLIWAVKPLLGFRRSSGDYRQQLKWLIAGGSICLAGFVLTLIGLSFAFAGILALPLGMGVGILRYRLYEIDRLISRTLSYALLTGLLVGVFAGLVLLTTRVLPFSSPVGVAASTLVAAGLFNPLRNRLQRLVDRRFNRARYDAEATVAAFAARLRDAVDVDTVLAELAAAAGRSLEPAHLAVWVRP